MKTLNWKVDHFYAIVHKLSRWFPQSQPYQINKIKAVRLLPKIYHNFILTMDLGKDEDEEKNF